MSDTSRTFEIKVTSAFDPAGVKQAADGLKKVGEEGGKSADKLFEKNTDVRKLLEAMGSSAIPGVGRAFGELAFGPIGVLVAISEAVELIKGGIDKLNQSLDTVSANSAKAFGNTDYISAYSKAIEDAARDTEAFNQALENAGKDADPTKTRYDAEASAIQKVTDALKDKLKAQEDAEIVAARAAAKHSGASSDVESAMEDQIRARYESQSSAIQAAAAQALQNALERELQERQEKEPSLEAAAATAKPSPEKATQRFLRNQELAAAEADLAKASTDANTTADDELKEQIEKQKEALEFSRKAYGNADPVGLVKQAEDELARLESETAQARATRAKQRIRELSQQVAKDDAAAADEKASETAAQNAAIENKKRISDLNRQIAAGNQTSQINSQSVPDLISELTAGLPTRDFERAAGVDSDSGATNFVNQFLRSQLRTQQHQGNDSDRQTIELMNQLLNQTRNSDGRTYLLLADLIRAKGDHARAIAELQQQLRNVSRTTR